MEGVQMAVVRILKNIFDKQLSEIEVNEGCTLEDIIRNNTDGKEYEGELVECYDCETGKTYYAQVIDEETTHAIVAVNGKETSLDYVIQTGDLIEIVITPAGDSWSWAGAIGGALAGAAGGAWLGFQIGGIGAVFTSGISSVVGAIVGGVIGAVVGFVAGGLLVPNPKVTSGTADSGIKGKGLPDIRGSSNQPLLDQPFPLVLGRHLVNPAIIGTPWTEISGVRGQNLRIHALYCVGYAPLKLTDFRLGEMLLAHNQSWSGNVDMHTIFHGAINGTDEGLNSKGIEYYQEQTAIELDKRPLVDGTTMQEAGWTEVPDDEIATVYSSAFSTEDETRTVLVTPIIDENNILSPEDLEIRSNEILAGTPHPEILLASFTGEDSIEKAEEYAIGLHESQAAYYGLGGGIVNAWRNNDVKLEILQNPPTFIFLMEN